MHDPWTPEFHHAALHLYHPDMNRDYLVHLARVFGAVGDMMADIVHPLRIVDDWQVVRDYLVNYEAVIIRELRGADVPRPTFAEIENVEDETPPVMRFDLLGRLVSDIGAERLRAAAQAVATWAAGPSDLLELDAEQVGWLRMLAAGATVEQVAASVPMSKRSMDRRLAEMRDMFEVDTTQAMVNRAIADRIIRLDDDR